MNIASYTFDCSSFEEENSFPVTWVVSGFDKNEWKNISFVKDAKLNHLTSSHTYTVNSIYYFKKYRFTQVGLSNLDNNYFCLVNFDMFGVLTTKPIQKHTQINSENFISNSFLFTTFLLSSKNN